MTGSDYYLGGLYTPGCVLIQPVAYIRALAAGLAPRVDIRERSPVTRLERKRPGLDRHGGKDRVTARKVILGVNGHVEHFGHFEGRLIHIFTYASMTEAFSGRPILRGRAALGVASGRSDGRDAAQGLRARDSSRIVIRTHFTYDPSVQVSDARVKKIAGAQRRSFDARFRGCRRCRSSSAGRAGFASAAITFRLSARSRKTSIPPAAAMASARSKARWRE